MENLKIDGQSITLVDQVEDKLLNYFRSQDLKVGDSIPNEIELSSALGVARSVLRDERINTAVECVKRQRTDLIGPAA